MSKAILKVVCQRYNNKLKDIELGDLQGDKIVKDGEVIAENCRIEKVINKKG